MNNEQRYIQCEQFKSGFSHAIQPTIDAYEVMEITQIQRFQFPQSVLDRYELRNLCHVM